MTAHRASGTPFPGDGTSARLENGDSIACGPRSRLRGRGVAAIAALRTGAAWLVVVALALGVHDVHADFRGKVVSVSDGDTLTVLVDRTLIRVRLAGIDAPERGQAFGDASRRSLASIVAARIVDVRERGRDRYGRVLGEVRIDGVDANAEQVRRGYAWVFRRYSHDARMIALEAEARAERRGLWIEPDPVPPWLWRERHHSTQQRGMLPLHDNRTGRMSDVGPCQGAPCAAWGAA
jgi:endonuclease YncB( thermonuclease family)